MPSKRVESFNDIPFPDPIPKYRRPDTSFIKERETFLSSYSPEAPDTMKRISLDQYALKQRTIDLPLQAFYERWRKVYPKRPIPLEATQAVIKHLRRVSNQ